MLYFRRWYPSTQLAVNEAPVSTPAVNAPDELTHAERTAKLKHTRLGGLLAALFLLALTLGCNVSDLILPATPTPVPTRALAPTLTPTPETLPPLIVVTPPQNGTPGVIIIQPTVEGDKIVVAIPPTDTPAPPPSPTPPPRRHPTRLIRRPRSRARCHRRRSRR